MPLLEYLAFEQNGSMYGVPISQIDVMTKSGTEGAESLDVWLGATGQNGDLQRILRVKESGVALSVSGVRGIFQCSASNIWPLPTLLKAHRQNQVLWGVCSLRENTEDLVLLIDVNKIEKAG
ncbi:MAG: hypothetical protein KDC45_03050 [Bacteroidetes bacterium]|nr:hypothetical protein [Bacteroidota bacterium]